MMPDLELIEVRVCPVKIRHGANSKQAKQARHRANLKEAKVAEDDWTGLKDAKQRKNRLNVRAHRRF